MPILQRELQESKSHLTKMQSSSSSSVAGLLQELKAAEDALSRERRWLHALTRHPPDLTWPRSLSVSGARSSSTTTSTARC